VLILGSGLTMVDTVLSLQPATRQAVRLAKPAAIEDGCDLDGFDTIRAAAPIANRGLPGVPHEPAPFGCGKLAPDIGNEWPQTINDTAPVAATRLCLFSADAQPTQQVGDVGAERHLVRFHRTRARVRFIAKDDISSLGARLQASTRTKAPATAFAMARRKKMSRGCVRVAGLMKQSRDIDLPKEKPQWEHWFCVWVPC
jgi:hypothetical protein